jgi:hypothetical protein
VLHRGSVGRVLRRLARLRHPVKRRQSGRDWRAVQQGVSTRDSVRPSPAQARQLHDAAPILTSISDSLPQSHRHHRRLHLRLHARVHPSWLTPHRADRTLLAHPPRAVPHSRVTLLGLAVRVSALVSKLGSPLDAPTARAGLVARFWRSREEQTLGSEAEDECGNEGRASSDSLWTE